MKIDPNEPATSGLYVDGWGNPRSRGGLPVRLHIAAMNMAATFSSNAYYEKWEHRAQDALAAADALLAKYNRTEEEKR